MSFRGAIATILLLAAACSGDRDPVARPAPPPDGKPPLLTPGARSPRIASYAIDVRYDPHHHRLAGRQTLTWRNTGQTEVRELPFHLYLNAFKNETTLFMRDSHGRHRSSQAARGGWGWIEVKSIELGSDRTNRRSRARYLGQDETVLELPLDQPIAPGATAEIRFEFEAQLPEVFARTGYKGDFTMVGQWFPKIGVRIGEPGHETWHCMPFHQFSEFFADFGNYDVSITVPDTHVVAATGVLVSAQDVGGGQRRLTYRAEDVHDFAWMADPWMETVRGTAHTALGAVEVRVYSRPEHRAFAERHLRAGIASIEFFSKTYVPYPWAVMSIISPPPDAIGAGGMEYPTLVTTAGDSILADDGLYLPEIVTVHEVGHNWFQGILASNEVEEAWLDEGINEYADSLALDEMFGESTSAVDWNDLRLDYAAGHRVSALPMHNIPDPPDTPSYRFADVRSYGMATYSKPVLAMRTLENLYGRERVRAAMKVYAQRFAFRHPSGADLFSTLEGELGEPLDWFIDPAFRRAGVADLRVRSVGCRVKRKPRGVFGEGDERRTEDGEDPPPDAPWLCDVLVVNLGQVPAPVDVEFELEDGSRFVDRWDDRRGKRWHRFSFERSARVVAVTIDPEQRVLLNDRPIESSWRVSPDMAASRRAAARSQFWTQTLMQLGGP